MAEGTLASAHLDLVSRIKVASGWDQQLDLDIALAIGWQRLPENTIRAILKDPDGRYHYTPPNFTGSIDTVLAIIPAQFWLNIETAGTTEPNYRGYPVVDFGHGRTKNRVQAKTIPLTLCLVALLTRSAADNATAAA